MNPYEKIAENRIVAEKLQSFIAKNLRSFYIANEILKNKIPKNGDLFIEDILGIRVLFWIVCQGDPGSYYAKGLRALAESMGYKEFIDYDIDALVGIDQDDGIDTVVKKINEEMQLKEMLIRKCLLDKMISIKLKRFIAKRLPFLLNKGV